MNPGFLYFLLFRLHKTEAEQGLEMGREEKETQNRILLSMPCCEQAVRDKLLEVVGNEEK